MSSRRKRAAPVRVDEEAKKKLNWNMLDDRKNESIVEGDDQVPTCSLLLVDSAPRSQQVPAAFVSVPEDVREEAAAAAAAAAAPSVRFTEDVTTTTSEATVASVSLGLTVVPASTVGHVWKALVGEFGVRPSWLPCDCEQKGLILHRIGDQLCLSYSSCDESSGLWKPEEDACTVDCSLSRIPLEDLDWLQKRRVVQLCHQVKEESMKVGIYLLETGLGKPEFLSEGNARLERQNVEELYDYVRHLHQRESQEMSYDVQHKALIPVLRPYQSQAVNWMRTIVAFPLEGVDHFVWKEVVL